LNYIKVTGHLDSNSEEIIVIIKSLIGVEYMGFSRIPYSPGFSSQINFPVRVGITASESWDLIEKIEAKLISSDSIQNGQKIQVCIEAD
jgi:hypothetical protein